MLLPKRCPWCRAIGAAPCARCIALLPFASDAPVLAALDGCVVLLSYEGPVRRVVAGVKYRNERDVAAWLASGLAERVVASGWLDGIDAVTWAPTTPARQRARGFDHAALLARAVARRLGRPSLGMLRRVDHRAQTGISRRDRLIGPTYLARRSLPGTRILLVDDVVTTGATLSSAARALRCAGASRVMAACAARTPARIEVR